MYRKNSLGNLLLLSLEKAVDATVRVNDFINNPGYYAYSGGGWDYPLNKSSLAKTLQRLRENGLIDFIDDSRLEVKLTDKGKEKAVLAKMLIEDSKWDRKWRIVIFDIPEKRRMARDLLRIKLKSWGFKPLQKSVWITKKNCTKPLRDYIKQIGIKDWVTVIESDNVDF